MATRKKSTSDARFLRDAEILGAIGVWMTETPAARDVTLADVTRLAKRIDRAVTKILRHAKAVA